MKNPHGVEPARYMKRKESRCAIKCDSNDGPIFCGNEWASDILIGDNCNNEYSCLINNDDRYGYECHPVYKKSLFVNSNEPDKQNEFSVLDYEVYASDMKEKDNINKISVYIDLSEESLTQFDDNDDDTDDDDSDDDNFAEY